MKINIELYLVFIHFLNNIFLPKPRYTIIYNYKHSLRSDLAHIFTRFNVYIFLFLLKHTNCVSLLVQNNKN